MCRMGIDSDIEKVWAKEWPSVVVRGRNHVAAEELFNTLRTALYEFYGQHGSEQGDLIMPTSNASGTVEFDCRKSAYEFPVYDTVEAMSGNRDGKRGFVRIKSLSPIHRDIPVEGCDFEHVPNRIRKQKFAVNFSMFGERRKQLNIEDRDAFIDYIAARHPGAVSGR